MPLTWKRSASSILSGLFSLAALTANPAVARATSPCDEPGAWCSGEAEVIDITITSCDGRQRCDTPAPLPKEVVKAPRPRARSVGWELGVSLGLSSGAAKGSAFLGPELEAGPYVSGDVQFLWSRIGKRWGLGFRLAALRTLTLRGSDGGFAPDADYVTGEQEGSMTAVAAGFLLNTHGFWFSAGGALTRYEIGGDGDIWPEACVAVGYDLALGDHFALRFEASGASMIVTFRGNAGAGLVARF